MARGVISFTTVAVGVYLIARAVAVSMTYDEAATYLRYGNAPLLAIFNFEVATNHFLNTLLARLFAAVFGPHELVLRLPSLLGYAAFAYFSARLVWRLAPPAIAAAAYVLLHVNPYTLDYFALSRGYGLSLGLLAGGLWAWWRAIDVRHDGGSPARDILRMCGWCGAAALANFATLNATLALSSVLLIAALVVGGRRAADAGPPITRRQSRRRWLALAIVVLGFITLVWSQDARLATSMYQPIVVRVAGADLTERSAIRVWRRDLRGRMLPVGRDERGAFPIVPATAVTGLRLVMPSAVADRAGVEVLIAAQRFWQTTAQDDFWERRDEGGTAVFETRPSLTSARSGMSTYHEVINWTGAGEHWRHIGRRTITSAATAVVLWLLLLAASWGLARLRLVPRDVTAPLAAGAAIIFALVGPPISILARNHELYFGGVTGLVPDVYGSLIDGTFYGRIYAGGQRALTLWVIAAAGVAGLIAAVIQLIRRTGDRGRAPLALAGAIAIASLAAVALHVWQGTPYPLGRTALYFAPLVVLFLAAAAASVATFGRLPRAIASVASGTVAAAAVAHFAVSANLRATYDWPKDASTKTMMADLRRVAVAAPGHDAAVLGVDWPCYASAAFYAATQPSPPIRVLTIPAAEPVQYLYVDERGDVDPLMILKRYPASGTALAKNAR